MPRKRKQLSIGPTFQTVRLQPPPPVSLANVDDLLMEILLRLPAKSLSRFKCVCKKWLSLISSDHLCHLHTLRRPKLQPSIILQFWGKRFYFNPSITINGEKKMIPYSPSVPDYHTIEQACNGLMLLKRAHIDPTTNQFGCFRKMSYYVYNPTTRQSREIMSFDVREYPEAIGLAFDPSKSPYYKIVCIRSIGESDVYTYQIEVYDSESHTWKLSLEPYIDNCPLDFSGAYGTYWNNAMYWRHNNNMGDDSYICFDIGKNEVKTLPFPETPPGFDESKNLFFNTYLQESDGHLYHFEYFNEQMWPEEDDKELVIVSVWELVVGHDDSQWIFKNHHRLTTAEHCAPYYILRSMGGSGLGLGLGLGSGLGSGPGSDGDGTCSLLTYWAGKMWAYRFLDKSYEDLLDLTIQPWFQPDYQKRLNVQYYQFGEVLALV